MMEAATEECNRDVERVPPQTLQYFMKILRDRRNKHQTTNFHAAHLLNPVTMMSLKPETLSDKDRDTLKLVAGKFYYSQPSSVNDFMTEYCRLLENLPGKSQIQKMRPSRWAALYANATSYPFVFPLLESFLAAKGSQSVAERGWSAVDFVSGVRRKRLKTERLQRIVDGFWWFRHTRLSDAPDYFTWSKDEDSASSGRQGSGDTTNDEDMECDENPPPHSCEVEKALEVYEEDVQIIRKSNRRQLLCVAETFLNELRTVGDNLKSVQGLLPAGQFLPMFDKLSKTIVCKETLLKSGVCQALAPYKEHTDMPTRLAVNWLLRSWRAIYMGTTQATSASEVD